MMAVDSLALSTVVLWADQVKRLIIGCLALQLIECVDVMMIWN